jgi:hypothetical protein
MTRADIRQLPEREFRDFLTIIELEIREEEAARRKGSSRGAGH